MKGNWKTSLPGILALIIGGASLALPISQGQAPSQEVLGGAVTAILAGVGLLQAKDKDVTGGSRRQ